MTPQTLPQTYDLVGEVEASRQTDVRSRVEGVILERPFVEGSAVKAGDLLYRLDRIKTDAAQASALARYNNAKSTLARLEPLLAKHAVAQQDVDNARADLDATKAALDQAKKDVDDSEVRAEVWGASDARYFKSAAASPALPTCSPRSTNSIRRTSSSARRRSRCSTGRRIPAPPRCSSRAAT